MPQNAGMDTRDRITRFLAGKRLAIAGVSRNPHDFSRAVLGELRTKGYDVVAVHPAGGEIDGQPVYPRVTDIPEPVDGVILMTSPKVALQVARDCEQAGVSRIWFHRGVGEGAVSQEAIDFANAHGMEVVAGECPLMFLGGSVHDVHRSLRRATGRLPLAAAERKAEERVNRTLLAVLLGVEAFVAVGALYGGLSFLLAPTGRPMGMPLPGEMPGLPFSSWLVPGLLLLVANGLLPILVIAGSFLHRPWARRGHLVVGMVLTAWIAVQVWMLGWISPLQPLMLGLGVVIFAFGSLLQARLRTTAAVAT